jgi:transcriptional regulator with XRE-family HTH domain
MGLNELIQIGDSIRKLRIKAGFTQKEMAKELGIPYSTYSNYENNNRTPSIDTLSSIAQKLEIDINDLFPVNLKDEYYSFLDVFCGWADLRGYEFIFSHDEATFLRNGGGQSVIIKKDDKTYEFTPEELKLYSFFLYEYFDAKFEIKQKEADSINHPILNAAHDNDATKEQKANANAIMTDDSEWD